MKHQFRRLDSVLHHVIHPQQHGVRTPTFSITSPSSPIFYPITVVRAFVPPDQPSATGSVHSRDTWDVKYAKEIDLHSIEPPDSSAFDLSISIGDSSATHIDKHAEVHSIEPTNTSIIDLSISVGDSSAAHIDMADEHHLPQAQPQLNLPAQDPPPSDLVEAEAPDPFLIDDEEDGESLSEEEADEEQVSSDAISQKVVLPTESVPLDLPSSPEASISQPQSLISPIPNLQKDTPLPPSESEEEYVPDLYVSSLIVPTMFLPIPNVRRSFSSNLLTWWLARSSMYDTRTRPIL